MCIFTHVYYVFKENYVYHCALIHNMEDFNQKQLDLEWETFTNRNFVKPTECRNLDQIRNYISQLCLQIEDSKKRFNYVPNTAYFLLAQYNSRQNTMLYRDFISSY